MSNKQIAAAVAVLVAGLTVSLVITSDDDGHGHKKRTITIRVDGVDRDTKPDETVVADAATVKRYDDAVRGDLGDSGLDAGAVPEPLGGPLAAQDFPGCRTQFVRNMSSRGGVVPRLIVLHYTVSADRGWASNNALTAMSNNPANGVSWHFSIGRKTGTCAYNVPLSMKAWTQANANPFSVGIEVVATGSEGVYVEGAGRDRLVGVLRELEHRLGIPNQRGLVSNCRLVRPGIVRHYDLGLCGGGHHDTNPFSDPIPSLIAAVGKVAVSRRDRRACRRAHRFRARRHHTRRGSRRQSARLARLKGRGLRCVDGRVKRR